MSDEVKGNMAENAGISSTKNLDQLAPKQAYEVMLGFTNTGDTSWNDNYQLASGDQAYSLSALGGAVPIGPGDTTYLTLSLVAGEEAGSTTTTWQLQDADGVGFGSERAISATVVIPDTKALGDYAYDVLHFENSYKAYTQMPAGQKFGATWILKNAGIQAWSGELAVVYYGQNTNNSSEATPDAMGMENVTKLHTIIGNVQVQPDQNAVIRLNLTAPSDVGTYSFHWQMYDPSGAPFGGVRWLQITTIPSQQTTTTPPDDKTTKPPVKQPPVKPPTTPEPPAANTIDILEYMRGDGRIYMMRTINPDGSRRGDERIQTQPHETDPNGWYIVKNSLWEHWRYDPATETIRLVRDISPADEGRAPTYYEVTAADGQPGGKWCKRYMKIGEQYIEPQDHRVLFRRKSDGGDPGDPRSGVNRNDTTFFKIVGNEIHIGHLHGEIHIFRKGYGRIGWNSPWGNAYISDDDPGTWVSQRDSVAGI